MKTNHKKMSNLNKTPTAIRIVDITNLSKVHKRISKEYKKIGAKAFRKKYHIKYPKK